jgi:Caspase domain
VALVIGNQHYSEDVGMLYSPGRDADDMAQALSELGFQVIKEKDQGKDEMVALIQQFAAASNDAEVAIFYFSGHGIQFEGDNYLIPIDVDDQEIFRDPKRYAIDMEDPLVETKLGHAHVKIYIFDACRESLRVTHKGITKGLNSLSTSARGSLIAYACAPGQVALDDPKANHSLFTDQLLKHLRERNDILSVFSETQDDVATASLYSQMPWLSFSPGLYHFALSNFEIQNKDTNTQTVPSSSSVAKNIGESDPAADAELLKPAAVKSFLDKHWEALESAHIDQFVADFGSSVDWYLEGPISVDYIRRQVLSSIRHFDKISHKIDGNIDVYELPDSRGVLVTCAFKYDFTLRSGTHSRGEGRDKVGLRVENGELRIFSVDQEITAVVSNPGG